MRINNFLNEEYNMNIGVIFDMDGVIVDNSKYHIRAWIEFIKKFHLELSHEEVNSWFGNTNRLILQRLFNDNLTEEKIAEYSDQKEILYRKIYEDEIKPLDGLIPFLKELKQDGCKLALATSAPPQNVEFVLSKTGVKNYFEVITDDTGIKNGKPDPEIFLKTAEKLDISPSACLVFEDSFHGIESANNAGMKVVGVSTTNPAKKLSNTEFNISNFNDISLKEVHKILNHR